MNTHVRLRGTLFRSCTARCDTLNRILCDRRAYPLRDRHGSVLVESSEMSQPSVNPPSAEFVRKANVQGMEGFRALYDRAMQDPEGFWSDVAHGIHWFE